MGEASGEPACPSSPAEETQASGRALCLPPGCSWTAGTTSTTARSQALPAATAQSPRAAPTTVRGERDGGSALGGGGVGWVSLILSPGSAIAPQRHITGSVRHSLNPAASPGVAGGQILHLLPHQGPRLPRGLSHRTSVTQADAHKGEMEEAPPASGVTSPGTCGRDRWGGS